FFSSTVSSTTEISTLSLHDALPICSAHVSSVEEARACIDEIGFPAILRPSFTMGGAGAAIAYHAREYDKLVAWGLEQSPRHQILDRKSTRLNSSHVKISYAVFCLKK